MNNNKTLPTSIDVAAYLQTILDEKRRTDSEKLVEVMKKVTGAQPVMWGPSIVGFGTYHYHYETDREGDTVAVGFAARKSALVLYGVLFYEQNVKLAKALGAFKPGKGCLYIKDLDKVDHTVLSEMIDIAYKARNNC